MTVQLGKQRTKYFWNHSKTQAPCVFLKCGQNANTLHAACTHNTQRLVGVKRAQRMTGKKRPPNKSVQLKKFQIEKSLSVLVRLPMLPAKMQ